jgi:hypothetical protein
MYMLVVVSSGSSVRIFIILGNLMIPGQISEGPVRTVCQSTTW